MTPAGQSTMAPVSRQPRSAQCQQALNSHEVLRFEKNWPKVKRHLGDTRLHDILVNNFNKFTYGRWRKLFTHGQVPFEFEGYD
jgi:hypothetical protein